MRQNKLKLVQFDSFVINMSKCHDWSKMPEKPRFESKFHDALFYSTLEGAPGIAVLPVTG